MDRRTALFLTLLGGLIPRGLLAQQSAGRRATTTKGRTRGATLQPVRNRPARDEDPVQDDPPPETSSDDYAAGLPAEPGQQWRTFDISEYTSLARGQNDPQNAIVEWIFRRTKSAPWHGDKIAVLSASRTQIRAYHNARVLKDVGEVVERFTQATDNLLSIRVRFVAASDTRWRYAVFSRLKSVGTGPQGQQVWTLNQDDAQSVLAQMQIYQGFKLIMDREFRVVNGQTLQVISSVTRSFTGGLQRESAAGQGFQPRAEQLEEGVTLRLSPLLTLDGDMLDAAIDLTANTVKNLHRTRVIAPRDYGPSEVTIDVPEVTQSRLNQTIKSWALENTLLVSAGIQPGILQSKTGLFNLRIPGTVPTGTELLVFINVKVAEPSRASNDRDDREPRAREREPERDDREDRD